MLRFFENFIGDQVMQMIYLRMYIIKDTLSLLKGIATTYSAAVGRFILDTCSGYLYLFKSVL